jgi:hypothetical protein
MVLGLARTRRNDLRNYMLHKGLPGCQMSVEAKKIGPNGQCSIESTVTLRKDSLLEWSGWHKISAAYLETAPDQLKLSTIAIEYGDKVLSFYKWFDSTLDDFHSQDLIELQELQDRYAQIEGIKSGA